MLCKTELQYNSASDWPHVADAVDPLQVQKVELEVAAEMPASMNGQDVAEYHRGLVLVTFHHGDQLSVHDSTPHKSSRKRKRVQ